MDDVKDKYDKLKELGSGRFGTVFKVKNKYLDRIEALKIIDNVTVADYDKQMEAKVQHKLKHNNVVEIYDAYVRNSKLYISMEYLDDGTLEKKAKDNYLTVRDVIKYLTDCLYGLQHIHNNGYIHRDLKPNNVLISSNIAKLSDFGLSDEMDEDKEIKSGFGYTYHRAPEVFYNKAYCQQSDIYAIGVTAFRVFNGDSFIKKNYHILDCIIKGTFPPRDVKAYRLDVPKKLIEVINTSLEVDILKRYTDAHQVRKALNNIRIPIDWILSVNNGLKQVWLGKSSSNIYKIEVSKKLLIDRYNIEVFKGIKTYRKVPKLSQNDVPKKDLNNVMRKLLTKDL